jgi:hypothetical protein
MRGRLAGQMRSLYAESLTAFLSREEEFKLQLDAAVQAQSAHKQLLEDSAKLTTELKQAEAEELEIGEQEEANKDAPKLFTEACDELEKLLTERTRVLTEAALKVEGQSGKMLKAKLSSLTNSTARRCARVVALELTENFRMQRRTAAQSAESSRDGALKA